MIIILETILLSNIIFRLSSFLLPFLQTTLPKAPALLLPEDNPPPPSVTNMSTRGEPSEIQGDTIKGDAGHDFQDVLRIFGRGKLEIDEDPLDIIVKEKLDEKGSMLLEGEPLPLLVKL